MTPSLAPVPSPNVVSLFGFGRPLALRMRDKRPARLQNRRRRAFTSSHSNLLIRNLILHIT
jgi:hypothetical protein